MKRFEEGAMDAFLWGLGMVENSRQSSAMSLLKYRDAMNWGGPKG